MNDDERRTVAWSVGMLLVASLLRFGWEARPIPPLFPADTTMHAALVEGTRAAVADEERRRTPLADGERLDPNADPPVELARLPGVGPALAERIVHSRENEGPFLRVEDLTRVQGIGPATLDRLRPHLEVRAVATGAPVRAESSAGSEGSARVAVNRASEAELVVLPGVGPALARRIVEARDIRGGFQVAEDLLDVPGIGPATLERMRPLILIP